MSLSFDPRHAAEASPPGFVDAQRGDLAATEDFVPPAQAEAVFVGLRRLGKRVELRRYPGEDHWPGMWREPSVRDLHARVLAWFDEHLRG